MSRATNNTAMKPRVEVEIDIASDLWRECPRAEEVVRGAIDAAATATRALLPAASETSIVLTDDATIAALNRDWRGKDAATNVLSFPTQAGGAAKSANGMPALLGDIAIAFETTAREAGEEGKPLDHHLAHLAVHGFLHLLGYDHESDDEAEAMERLERVILARLGVPDPYAASEV